MRIRKFNESVNDETLLYYAFDWDDNLLFMSTSIILLGDDGEEINISTGDFAKYRTIIGKEDFDYNGKTIVGYSKTPEGKVDFNHGVYGPFRNFRDENDPEIFKKDTIDTLKSGDFGPAWGDFIECLTHGSIFAIITARGHESEGIRLGVEYIIDEYLTTEQQQQMYDYLLKYKYHSNENTNYDRVLRGKPSDNELVKSYLDLCDFIGVSAPSKGGTPDNPEEAKRVALTEFKRKVDRFAGNIGKKAMIGFSDDDLGNVENITDLFKEINHEEFPNIIKYVIKNTHGGGVETTEFVKKFESVFSNKKWYNIDKL